MNRQILQLVFLATALAGAASATSITFVGETAGNGTISSDGWVHQILIDGAPQVVNSFSYVDSVFQDGDWDARIQGFSRAAAAGIFGPDWLAGVSTQLPGSDNGATTGSLFRVFASSPVTTVFPVIRAELDQTGITTGNGYAFNSFVIYQVDRPSQGAGLAMVRVYQTPAILNARTFNTPTPEPGTIVMLGTALAGLALGRKKLRSLIS